MTKKSNRRYIIVNADDYGISSSVNKAILQSFERCLISTTTIMSNMPGFEETSQLAHEKKITDRIGIHINLTTGRPLTEEITRLGKFCNLSGDFCFKPHEGHFLSSKGRAAVLEEMEAQVHRCIEAGIKPTHIDSHHRCHDYWAVGKLVIEIAKKFRIPAVRLCHNWGNRISLKRKIYAPFANRRLMSAGLAKTNYFCSIEDVNRELLDLGETFEVMVHPTINNHGLLTNYGGESLIDLIEKFLPNGVAPENWSTLYERFPSCFYILMKQNMLSSVGK